MIGVGRQLVLVCRLHGHIVPCVLVRVCIATIDLLAVSRPASLASLAGVPRRHIPAATETNVPGVEMFDVVEWGGLGVLG